MKNNFFLIYGILFILAIGCVNNEKEVPQIANTKNEIFEKLMALYPSVIITPLENNGIQSQNDECKPPTISEDDCSEFTLTNFPVDVNGCNVKVTVNVRICTDPITGKVYFVGFWGFSYTFGSGNCLSFLQQWSGLYLDGKYTDLYTTMDTFYRNLTLQFELEYISTLNVNILDCPNYSNLGQFYEADCHQLCATLDLSSQEPFYLLSRVKCGDGCCRRTTSYCRRPDGTIEQLVTGAGPWGEPGCEPVTVICGGNVVPVVGCKDPCERI